MRSRSICRMPGARFYTYPATISYVLEEAAARKMPVFLFDRPNPIGADIVQGPVLDPAMISFTGAFAMPIRHGMTLGELARMINEERQIGARLTIIPIRDYRRDLYYADTGLTWTNPSPNLRSPDAALLYAGLGLIEGANLSVGRGTAEPFGWVGAPWIDGDKLTKYLFDRAIPGVTFAVADRTPDADAFAGKLCHGVAITLIDRNLFDAPRLGLELAAALSALYPNDFSLDGIRGSLGSLTIFDALKSGVDPRYLPALWQGDLNRFLAVRAKYLIY